MWCYAAQTYRSFGTAAEYAVVPGAGCLPRHPDITAHRAVYVAAQVEGRTVLVQGARVQSGLWPCSSRIARGRGLSPLAERQALIRPANVSSAK